MGFMSEVAYDAGYVDGMDRVIEPINDYISTCENKGDELTVKKIISDLKFEINDLLKVRKDYLSCLNNRWE